MRKGLYRLGIPAVAGLACCGVGAVGPGHDRDLAFAEVDRRTYLAPADLGPEGSADDGLSSRAWWGSAAARPDASQQALVDAWQPVDEATMAGDLTVSPAQREMLAGFLAAVRAAGALDAGLLDAFKATVLSCGRTLVVALAGAPQVVFKTENVVTAKSRPDRVGVETRFARLRKVARACDELGLDHLIVPRALMVHVDDGVGPAAVLAEERIDFADDLILQQEPFWQPTAAYAPALAQVLRLTARTGLDDLAPRNVAWVTQAGAPARLALLDIEYFAANPADALAGTRYPPGLLRMVSPATLERLLSLAAEEGVLVENGARAAARQRADKRLVHRRALADWQQRRGLVDHPGSSLHATGAVAKGGAEPAVEAAVATLVAAFNAAVGRRKGLELDSGARRTVMVDVDGAPASGDGSPPWPWEAAARHLRDSGLIFDFHAAHGAVTLYG